MELVGEMLAGEDGGPHFGDGRVAFVARCGMTPDSRGNWRMTSNVPWANACRNCRRSKPRNLYRLVEA